MIKLGETQFIFRKHIPWLFPVTLKKDPPEIAIDGTNHDQR